MIKRRILAPVLSFVLYSLACGAYNPTDAISYAETWWDGRNSIIYDECDPYQDFDSRGGDCANFVSQCLIAGGLDLRIHPDAWACGCFSTCTDLNDYLVNTLDITPEQRFEGEGVPSWFEAGDVAIFGYSDDHPRTHAVFAVTGVGLAVTCDAHSADQHQLTIQEFYDISALYDPNPLDRCTFYHIPRSEEPVYFADENLKAAIKAVLGITTDPTATDMLRLTYLGIPLGDIFSLVGLEHAVNMQTLELASNRISNVEPLSGLSNLEFLSL